jgi:hypothetical protein
MPDDKSKSSKSRAASRLDQVQSHLGASTPSSGRRRRKATKDGAADDELPADYSDILQQVSMLKRMAATPDPANRGYARQLKAGKMWVRERVEAFVDAGTFREVGSVSGTVKWRQVGEKREEPVECGLPDMSCSGLSGVVIPSNNVQGFGKLGGRTILFTADDYSIRAGHADGSLAAKTVRKLPLSVTMLTATAIHGTTIYISQAANHKTRGRKLRRWIRHNDTDVRVVLPAARSDLSPGHEAIEFWHPEPRCGVRSSHRPWGRSSYGMSLLGHGGRCRQFVQRGAKCRSR